MPKDDRRDIVGLASSYEAGTVIAPHAHDAHQIAHAISGTMRVSVQNTQWFVPPGCALWIPANATHAIECVGRVEMRTAYLSKAYPPVQASAVVVSVSPLMREVLVRLSEVVDRKQNLLLADVLLNEIKRGELEPLSIPIPRDPRIAELARLLLANPADQTTLAAWAKRLGFSERSLIRSIRAETGMTFRELRRLTRIMVALDGLSAGKFVTEIAFEVGFQTPSAFIHAFRLLVGKTPRQFISEG
ncbi:helix-turn-helix transcriptional regulator [Ruegeria sp. 2205SS24-7]|uniref:AraC family transcriptional regulator n=1 Tax=Ruegeria discodermiae TaxID=3064389 RepID=UPI00274177A3|nr:helix-turn-helix transcriptional regulator [Ruegeria sp. 2205SS24-7]MDP5218043.1 helix-turn-helix transcriptional regulator [Ruegeria sp. 2205SS24-7]